MSPEEIREQWSRFLAGEELAAEDQKNLVDTLEGDPELRRSLLDNLQLDGVLHALGTSRREGEAFVENLVDCIGAERDATRFVRKIERRLKEDPVPPTTPPSIGSRIAPPGSRIPRRRPAAPSSGETGWTPALIAAAAFVAILLLVTAPSRDTRPSVAKLPAPVVPNEIPLPEPSEASPTRKTPEAPRPAPTIPESKPEEVPAPARSERERPKPVAEPKMEVLPPPPPKPSPIPATTVEAAIPPAVVERVEGTVYIARSKSDKQRARKDEVVGVGSDLETYPSSSARLRFHDGTWVDIGPGSSFRETAAPTSTKGRQVFLASGSLESKIAKQPADRPMVFATPSGEATILGTTVRLAVGHEPKPVTTLEVREGKALLTRLLDRKSVQVLAGQFATTAPGADPVAHKSFPDEILVKFGPADVQLQPGWVLDSGEEFDPSRGYGWIGPKNGPVVPGLFWRDGEGKLQPRHRGRVAVRRGVPPGTDPLKATDVTAGWATQSETWILPVPNGRYLISVCCGDLTYEQGPHHVWVEGVQIIDQKKNRVGESIEVKDVPVEVRDGELTMKVGGNPPGSKVSSDGSSDSCINYLLIKRVRK